MVNRGCNIKVIRKNISIVIILLIYTSSCQINNQKSNSEEPNNKIDLIELINEIRYSENCKYSISKNKKNFAIACPINDSIERKAWKWKINLYKRNGELVGTSDSEYLYDEIFIPLGNDSTLLVIFPVGTSPFIRIKFYSLKQGKFQLINTIEQESNFYLFDNDFNGNNICYGISNSSSNDNFINYCNSSGDVIWSRQFINDYPSNLKISKFNNYIFLAIRSNENKSDIGMVFNNTGDKLIDFELPDNRRGNFKICTSNDDTEKNLVIYCSNFMIHLENNATKIMTSHLESSSNIYLEDCLINQDGSIHISGYKYEKDSLGKRSIIDTIYYNF